MVKIESIRVSRNTFSTVGVKAGQFQHAVGGKQFAYGNDGPKAAGVKKLDAGKIKDDARASALGQVAHLFLELNGAGGINPVIQDEDGQNLWPGLGLQLHGGLLGVQPKG
jgi:hypothetical protein